MSSMSLLHMVRDSLVLPSQQSWDLLKRAMLASKGPRIVLRWSIDKKYYKCFCCDHI